MQFVFSWLIGLIFHLNCNLTERKLFFTYMLYNVYLISSVLARGRDGSEWEGRGGEGSVEKNGGGTWLVTNDNSYIYIFEFI